MPALSTPRLSLTQTKEGLALEVDVKVRASSSRIVGVVEGRLQVAISSPPVDGAANQALIKLLAKSFGIRRGQVSLVGGERHKRKRLELRGLSEPEVRSRLP